MNITLQRCTSDDKALTAEWLVRQYGFDPQEVDGWLHNLRFNWPMSVKAVAENGDTVGLLNMSDYRIDEETEQIMVEQPKLIHRLNQMRYIAVFSFIVSEQYRHTQLNYNMLMSIWPELEANDFVYIPVMHSLKTHQDWKRWGAVEFYRDTAVVHYMIPFSGRAAQVARERCEEA